MTMTIGGQTRYGTVSQDAWDALADALGIRKPLLRSIRSELATIVPARACAIAARPEFTNDEREFLQKAIDIIDEHAKFVLGRA